MGIDTPSDEFYNINTTQYVPPVSAMHNLHPRLPKPKFDEFDDYLNESLSITPQIASIHNLLVNKHTTQWGVINDFFPMKRHLKSWNPEDKFPHDPGGRIICQLIKYLKKLFAI